MLRFYNTLTRQKDVFQPLEPGQVRMYTCGPTVYNYPHIGNYRAYIFEDVLRRYLKYRGYQVTQVMNLTDVEDKTIRDSQKAGMTLSDFTAIYSKAFFEDLQTLTIEPAECYPAATEHIPEMVAIIQQLQERGYTYTIDGSIYYRIDRFPDYGKLAHLDAETLQHGASGRVDNDEYAKDDMRDFALWKSWTPDDGDVYWETPLGKGRPGWHIECSAMSMKYLGKHFDIHTGGEDNIFPHHENEIAQSEAATGESFVNYWLHCRHLLVDNQKMSKSMGNFYTLRDLLDKGFKPKSIRYALLSIHYRQPLNFTLEGLHAADQAVQRLLDFAQHVRTAQGAGFDVTPLLAETQQRFEEALDDDLNMSGALGAIFEMVREVNRAIAQGQLSAAGAAQVTALLECFDTVLGLLTVDQAPLDQVVERLMEERQQARKSRDFARADVLREQLREHGYVVEDTPQGPRLKRL
ncbi:MAG: cysteine--tRNA ligase [Candidatus Tectomicrobia bacterium]|uniref:Cysteine--tRNA ligase n=1 Tax=Tectimicrobiota bacterium TaxID=2528274 RepID=A0A938B3R0_UNCTE|nr:cysteine--tRNA ligase [Candidatus Tectomicrobia bacterium]